MPCWFSPDDTGIVDTPGDTGIKGPPGDTGIVDSSIVGFDRL